MRLGGVTVAHRTCDQMLHLGQVVHTHVPLFTKQYDLVPVVKGR